VTIPTEPLDTAVAAPAGSVPSRDAEISREILEEVARLGLAEHFPAVVALTRGLFGEFEVQVEEDPEIANWYDVVFRVRVGGTIDEILDKDQHWHRRIPHDTTAAAGAFCLVAISEA
jgi:hypothetical protein